MDKVRVNNTREFQTRLGARLLDGLILGVPLHIIGVLIFGTGIYDSNDPISYKASSFGSIFFLAYDVGMWVFADGATIGKKILKIKIVKNDGTPLTFGSALVRWFSYIIVAKWERGQVKWKGVTH